MKIANLIVTSQNGGAEQVFLDYTRLLKKLGHDVVPIVKNDAPYANNLSSLKKFLIILVITIFLRLSKSPKFFAKKIFVRFLLTQERLRF